MNKEDYVSLEVAKILKEKGFDLKCNHYWGQIKDQTILDWEGFNFTKEWLEVNNNFYDDVWSAPNLYEAAKWLRSEHDINVVVATEIPVWFDRIPDSGDTLYVPFITYKKEDGKTEVTILRNLKDFNYEKVHNDSIIEALKLI